MTSTFSELLLFPLCLGYRGTFAPPPPQGHSNEVSMSGERAGLGFHLDKLPPKSDAPSLWSRTE